MATAKPLVSVVTPTRNRVRYLQEAVASVQAQTFTRWELIVVDDASEDDTPAWLQSISDSRLRVLRIKRHVERRGSAARNRGLAEATGDYVLFLDDDDRLRPRALARLVRALQRHPDAVAAYGARIEFDEAGHRKLVRNVWIPRVRTMWPEILARGASGTGQEMFPTELVRSIGGWNESLKAMEDWDLRLRMSRLGPICQLPYAVRECRLHPEQWRPTDQEDARVQLMQAFVESLPASERALGEGAVRIRLLTREAETVLHHHNDPASALRLLYDAYRSAPALARSPLLRVRFLRGFGKAPLARVSGHRRLVLLGSMRRNVQRLLRRAPGRGFSTKIRHSTLASPTSTSTTPFGTEPASEVTSAHDEGAAEGALTMATAKPLVSVVIPTRNRVRYLQEAVASVQAQTMTRWELIVVDDASEDDTPAWLQSVSDSRLRVLRLSQPVERAAVRNRGLAEATGDYVLFLDDDDRLRPRALTRLVRALERHPEAVAACGARIEFDDRGHRKQVRNVWIPRTRTMWPDVLARGASGTGQELFPTELLRSIGGWNESPTANVIEDWELRLRMSHLGPMCLLPYAVRECRQHPEQWKPHDQEESRSHLMQNFLASLPASERALGEGAVRIRWLYSEAESALHHRHDPGTALRLFSDAYRSAPALARSPLLRFRFLRGFTKALFARACGPRGLALLGSTRRNVQRVLRRAPGRGFSPKIREDPPPEFRRDQ